MDLACYRVWGDFLLVAVVVEGKRAIFILVGCVRILLLCITVEDHFPASGTENGLFSFKLYIFLVFF